MYLKLFFTTVFIHYHKGEICQVPTSIPVRYILELNAMINETNGKIINSFINKPLSDSDMKNIEIFIEVANSDKEKKYVEINCKLKALRLTKGIRLQHALKHPVIFIKYYFWDLDFGPFDRVLRFIRRTRVKRVLSLYDAANVTLVDVGCGRQANVGWVFKKKVKKYIGVDRDIPSLRIDNIHLIKSTAEDMLNHIEEKSADLIIALAVIEHVKNPREFVQICKKILKEGGQILITTPAPYADPILKLISKFGIINGDEIAEHNIYFTPQSLSELLESEGFKVLSAKKFLFGLNGVVHCSSL